MNAKEIDYVRQVVSDCRGTDSSLYWSPDDSTCLEILRVTNSPDEGQCAYFNTGRAGKYVMLENADIREFMFGTKLVPIE